MVYLQSMSLFSSTLLASSSTVAHMSAGDVLSQQLFRLAADPDIMGDAHRDSFVGILNALEGFGRFQGSVHVSNLKSDDPTKRALSLAYVGSKPDAIKALLVEAPGILRDRVTTTPTLNQTDAAVLTTWLQSLQAQNSDSEIPANVSMQLGSLMYIPTSLLRFFSGPIVTAAAGAITGANIMAGGSESLTVASASTALIMLMSFINRYRSASQMLTHADQAALVPEQIETYLQSFGTPGALSRLKKIAVDPNGSLQDVVQAMKASAGPLGMPPSLSRESYRRGLIDFENLASVGALGFERAGNDRYYDRAAQAIGLGVLQRLQWQPTVLHEERLAELQALRQRGARLIFLSNHRSHLDTLLSVSLLRDFRVRFVAKDELGYVPGLGWSAFPNIFHAKRNSLIRGAGSLLIDRKAGQFAMKNMREWMGETFKDSDQGHYSVFAFPEESRLGTPNRNEELGMRSYKSGLFAGAAHWADDHDIHFVPLSYYGVGRIFPKSNEAAQEQGILQNQPTAISIGAPISVRELREQSDETNGGFTGYLMEQVWAAHWKEVAALQAFMNQHSPRISHYEVIEEA